MIDTVVKTYDDYKDVVKEVEPNVQLLYTMNEELLEFIDRYQDVTRDIKAAMNCVGDSYARIVHKTLYADRWEGDDAPYSYKLGEYKYLIASAIIDQERASSDALDAAEDASIYGSKDSYLYAWGDKPTVDIPIIVGFVGLTTKT